MDLALQGKVAIVTGGSRGIGKAIASRLRAEGCRIAVCARDQQQLDAAAAELSADGDDVFAKSVDVSDPDAIRTFVDATFLHFKRIDILVNNAGTHLRGTVEGVAVEALERQLREKLFGFFTMIRAVLPIMRSQRDGRIVNNVGQAARHPHPDRFPSGVTNSALMGMTKSIADAVARDNVRVNTVCPQYIETELVTHLIAKEMRERGVDRATAASGFTRANVLGRLGLPEEVADLVAFLASDRARFITGSAISIDGGYHRYVFG